MLCLRLKAMLIWIFTYLFGCTHRHTTWPHHHAAGFDYVCCLDCGAELPYSVGEMRIASGSGAQSKLRKAVPLDAKGQSLSEWQKVHRSKKQHQKITRREEGIKEIYSQKI